MKILILLLPLVLYGVYVFKLFKDATPLPPETVVFWSGTIGSGKTLSAVNAGTAQVAKINKLYKQRKNPIYRLLGKYSDKPARLYSNIPIKNGYVLERDHLLFRKKFDENYIPVVVLDELGTVANQYSYDDKNVISQNVNENIACLENFIRFFRHVYGDERKKGSDQCRLFITDQSVANVNVSVRRRIGKVLYLYNRYRPIFLPFFFKVNVRELILAEDTLQNINPTLPTKDELKKEPYMLVFAPPFKKKTYDSHCYSNLIETGAISYLSFEAWNENELKMKTNYIPDVHQSRDEKFADSVERGVVNAKVKEAVKASL